MKIYSVVIRNGILNQAGVVGVASTPEKAEGIKAHYAYMADECKIFESELDHVGPQPTQA